MPMPKKKERSQVGQGRPRSVQQAQPLHQPDRVLVRQFQMLSLQAGGACTFHVLEAIVDEERARGLGAVAL